MPSLKRSDGKLVYRIRKFSRKTDTMTLVDPHTGRSFVVENAREVIKRAKYKVVK